MPIFQARHYRLISLILSTTARAAPDLFTRVITRTIAEAFADAFETDNARFDRARFIAACQPTGKD